MRTRRTARPLLALALLAALVLVPSAVRANGVPIRIPLTYVNGLSNWGPVDARGEAEVALAEAIVKLDARGLPVLTGETYQVWLAKSGTNKAISVGTFNAAPDGTAGFTGKLTGLDGYDYDLVLLTVEPLADPDPAPSAKRSIGGYFSPLKKQDSSAPGIAADTQPATLPNTGDTLPAPNSASRHGPAIVLFVFGGLMLYLTARRRRA